MNEPRRVSFARGLVADPSRRDRRHRVASRHYYYVQIGPRYRERVWGSIIPPGSGSPNWTLESTDQTYRTYHRSLAEAREAARRLLEGT